MSKIYALIVALASVLMLGDAAWATPVGMTDVGPVGPLSPSMAATVISDLDTLLGRTDVVYLGKATRTTSQLNNDLFGPGEPFAGENVSLDALTYTGGVGGTWAFNPGTSSFDVAAIVVVTHGHGYIYLSNSFANTGSWTTADIDPAWVQNLGKRPRIYFLGVDPPRGDVGVPEPLSLALLGGGLFAMVMLARRKRVIA